MDNMPSAAGQNDTPADLFVEFISSAWRAGVEQPAEGFLQLVGANPEHVQLEDNVDGAMKTANQAGIVAGQIVDITALTVAAALGFKGLGLQSKFASGISSTLFANGFAGTVYGGVFTPVASGESQWTRLQNAAVDGGTFMTLGGATHGLTASLVAQGTARGLATATLKAGETYVPNIIDRALVNSMAGAAAGLANVQLDANVHGQLMASTGQYATGALDWALGNLVAGEAFHQVGQAAKRVGSFTKGGGADAADGPPSVKRKPEFLFLSQANRDQMSVLLKSFPNMPLAERSELMSRLQNGQAELSEAVLSNGDRSGAMITEVFKGSRNSPAVLFNTHTAVAPEMRGQGIESAMTEAAVKHFQIRYEAPAIFANVAASDTDALNLYISDGWKEVSGFDSPLQLKLLFYPLQDGPIDGALIRDAVTTIWKKGYGTIARLTDGTDER